MVTQRYTTAKTRRLPNAGLMLGQRLRRWPNVKPTFGQYLPDL